MRYHSQKKWRVTQSNFFHLMAYQLVSNINVSLIYVLKKIFHWNQLVVLIYKILKKFPPSPYKQVFRKLFPMFILRLSTKTLAELVLKMSKNYMTLSKESW